MELSSCTQTVVQALPVEDIQQSPVNSKQHQCNTSTYTAAQDHNKMATTSSFCILISAQIRNNGRHLASTHSHPAGPDVYRPPAAPSEYRGGVTSQGDGVAPHRVQKKGKEGIKAYPLSHTVLPRALFRRRHSILSTGQERRGEEEGYRGGGSTGKGWWVVGWVVVKKASTQHLLLSSIWIPVWGAGLFQVDTLRIVVVAKVCALECVYI